MLSRGLIQISGDKAKDNLQQASYNVNKEKKHNASKNEGNPDLELVCKGEDIAINYRQIYFNSQRSFHSSFIIVITGPEKEVFTAESYIISILKSELIEVQIPTGRQLEMFLSALPFYVSDSKAWVGVRSDTAAVLCTSTNLNSRTDDKGLYFGKDLKTNAEILIDRETLPARHFTFLGATGSGKTYSLMLLLMRMRPGLGDQTLDHYSSVVQLAGLLRQYEVEEIVINHNRDVDISCKINGQKIGFEYENYNNKNLDIIVQKKEAALKKYDVVRFISSSTDIKMISKAVGERYSIKKGSAVTDFIESLTEIAEYPLSKVVSGGIEPIEAL